MHDEHRAAFASQPRLGSPQIGFRRQGAEAQSPLLALPKGSAQSSLIPSLTNAVILLKPLVNQPSLLIAPPHQQHSGVVFRKGDRNLFIPMPSGFAHGRLCSGHLATF